MTPTPLKPAEPDRPVVGRSVIMLVPTPARVAGLGDTIDPSPGSPPISTLTAVAIIGAGYLLFFARGIGNAINIDHTGQVLGPIDYSTFPGIQDVVTRLAQIAGALLLFWLFWLLCRYLQIHRQLAGIPRYPAPPQPALGTLAVAFTGMLVANLLLIALQGPDPNAAGGGVVGNPWAVFSLVSDINAGVVEEIVIVAIPVLIGRRAGWHPIAIIALSMLLRWPFHIYHGAWASLPWAAIWGGSNVIAFLYLRRLAPLIAFHAAYDAYIGMQSAYGDTGGTIVLISGAVLVLGLVVRITPERRRRLNLNPAVKVGDAKTVRYLLFRGDPLRIAVLVGGTILIAMVIAVEVTVLAPDITSKIILALAIASFLGVVARVLWSNQAASNVIVRRDPAGVITGVIRWHTTYTGDTSIDTVTARIGLLDAITTVAGLDGNTLSLAPTKTLRAKLKTAGWALPHGWRRYRRIRITPEQAAAIGTSVELPDMPHPHLDKAFKRAVDTVRPDLTVDRDVHLIIDASLSRGEIAKMNPPARGTMLRWVSISPEALKSEFMVPNVLTYIFAHELGHLHNYQQRTWTDFLALLPILPFAGIFAHALAAGTVRAVVVTTVLLFVVGSVCVVGMSALSARRSRSNEWTADRVAVDAFPRLSAVVFKKLAQFRTEGGRTGKPQRRIDRLLSTHPPLHERRDTAVLRSRALLQQEHQNQPVNRPG